MDSPGGALRTGISVVGLMILGAAISLLPAQSPTGEIRVEVRDPSGVAMIAAVKLAGSHENFKSGTDGQGRYTFTNLPYGRYRLEVSKNGFATQSVLVDVQDGAPISRTVTLALADQASRIDVVAPTPLPGTDLPVDEIPSPVQTAAARDLERSGTIDLSNFLSRRFNSVHVNEIQGNPYQPDVNYRGYTASPLLGTPQGLSVYMDGVRLNQPFGDVVSWDLIPRIAISEVALMSGSNPLFGLNTLGGALSITTKDGYSDPRTAIQLSGGSFGRKAAEVQQGGSNAKGWNWFLAGNLFFEDGWRRASPSDVRQFFGKLGWRKAATTLGLSVSFANNSLTGNGLQEQRFVARDYASVYTLPDTTANRAASFGLSGRHTFNGGLSVSGNAYYRYIRTNTLNGDVNEASLDQSVYQPSAADIRALMAAGYTGFPTSGANATNTPFPFWRCLAQVLQKDEPAEKCDALLNRTRSQQQNYGTSAQLTWLGSPRHTHNQFTAGAAYDGSVVNFAQSSQLGFLNPDLTVTGVNAFGDGVTGGTTDGAPFDNHVDLHGLINTGSVFATNTLSAGKWNLTLSGRYNRTTIDNRDRVQPDGSGSLTGRNSFGRFNPGAGFTFNPTRTLNGYLGYSEGSRAPTSIELGCADPAQPCKLPNALAGDPPLQEVVTRTFEAGLRGGGESAFNWNVGWFRAKNHEDILFVASTQSGFGYFKNFGQTLRQGVEANIKGRVRRLSLGGGYTFLEATYESAETILGSSNSTNGGAVTGTPGMNGTIQIQPGDRIPLIPRHLLKAFVELEATKTLLIDLDFVAASRSYARGNENNLSQPDGKYYLGPGSSPGYGVVNVGAHYQIRERVQVFVQINNLLDHRYYSAAQLGPTAFSDQGTFLARPFSAVNGQFPLVHATFYAPGAPIGAWGGIRFKF